VQTLLQSALAVALCIIRANPTVLEGLGAYLEGNYTLLFLMFGDLAECSLVIATH
jgi:hypothetical protein